MGTTWITLTKIAGPLVGEVEQLFRRWAEYDSGELSVAGSAMVPEDDNPRVSDPAIMTQMVALVTDLERHATAPPVVHFARYLDPWTTAASLFFASGLASDVRLVLSSEIELAFFRPSGRTKLKRSIQKSLRVQEWKTRFNNFEEYQFTNQLHQCLISWEDLLEAQGVETGIVLAFRLVGGCWLDEEVEASVATLPTWFQHEARGEGSGGL